MSAPPPSAALLRRVAAMGPVRTRVPSRTLVGVAALSLLYGSLAFVARPMRDDLPVLSSTWLVLFGAVWLIGFIAPLVAVLLPRRGAVLPDVARASRVAAVAAAGLILVGLLLGRGRLPVLALASALGCVVFSLEVWAGVLVLGVIALRRVITVGSWRAGAALGAAGGALAGLILHLVCPYGNGIHVGLAHGGGVVVCALLGAALCPLFLEP